ncbi:MAG TPA: serine--tRNA ligase, partial [Polyangiaceae bacterium]
MLDARYVADHLAEVREKLARRSPEDAASLDGIAEIGKRRRELIAATERPQAERNAASEAMAKLAKSGDKAALEGRRAELKKLSEDVKQSEALLREIEAEVEQRLLVIPNVPHESVPDGKTDAENPVVRTWGEKPAFDFEPLSHWDIGEKLGILDQNRAAKISGARFSVLWGAGARLERALVTFMLDLHTREQGYFEVYPPFLVKAEALRGTGNFPKFEGDVFKTQRRDPDDAEALYLIPTA